MSPHSGLNSRFVSFLAFVLLNLFHAFGLACCAVVVALAELINNSDDSDAYTLQTVGASGARLDNENVVAPGAPHAVVGTGLLSSTEQISSTDICHMAAWASGAGRWH